MSHAEGCSRIRVLYDGECPLCSREIRFLKRRDRGRGRLQFEDISNPDFDPGRYGVEVEELMARIHGVLPGGDLIEVITPASSSIIGRTTPVPAGSAEHIVASKLPV